MDQIIKLLNEQTTKDWLIDLITKSLIDGGQPSFNDQFNQFKTKYEELIKERDDYAKLSIEDKKTKAKESLNKSLSDLKAYSIDKEQKLEKIKSVSNEVTELKKSTKNDDLIAVCNNLIKDLDLCISSNDDLQIVKDRIATLESNDSHLDNYIADETVLLEKTIEFYKQFMTSIEKKDRKFQAVINEIKRFYR